MLHTQTTLFRNIRISAILSMGFLLVLSGLFFFPTASMDDTSAATELSSSELNITTSDINLEIDMVSPHGTFKESTPAEVSVTTDHYTGYVLSISPSENNENSTKLINQKGTAAINSISSTSSQNDFTNNTWGIKPSKVNGEVNTSFLPSPTQSRSITIDTTNEASTTPTVYNLSIAAKIDHTLPADTYSNTFVFTAVGNPSIYSIEYDKNVTGDVSNMPEAQASSTNNPSFTLRSNRPTSAKKYQFKGWCDGTVVDHDGEPECIGDVYQPGDEFYLNQTTDNHIVLYGMWDTTATLAQGSTINRKLAVLSNGSNNIAAVKSADSLPEGFAPTSTNIISDANSPNIYAWYDNTDNAQTIYIHTDEARIKTNQTCENMFRGFRNLADISGLTNWDTSNTISMSGMFYQVQFLTNINALVTGQRPGKEYVSWDTSSVRYMGWMFYGDYNLANIDGATNWDTSSVIDMKNMFYGVTKITDINALSTGTRLGNNYVSWNTSNVADMTYMFYGATSLANIDGATNWNTSSVTSMSFMFQNATSLANIDGATSWDTSNVTSMSAMFYGAASLANIDGATNWNTSNVTNMESMFRNTKIANIDALSTGTRLGNNYVSWDTSNVTNMSYMFNIATLTDISGATNWNTSSATNMRGMFARTSITNLGALTTGVREGDNYISWDTSNVTDMGGMFANAHSLTDISGITNWDTSSVTNMYNLFLATNITNLGALTTGVREGDNYISWDTSNVTDMGGMFSIVTLTDISGITNWDTSSATNMSDMFGGTKITSANALITGIRPGNDYVSWDTSNVTNMASMFTSTSSLTDISALSSWNTHNVTNMQGMFHDATSLADISSLSNWDTSNVTKMGSIFRGVRSLINIDYVSNWNTSSVTDMNQMFRSTSITNLDVLTTGVRPGNDYVSWDTSNVTNMGYMFEDTPIVNINGITNWNTSNVTNMESMFRNTKITNVDALATGIREGNDYVSWETSKVANMTYMFQGNSTLTNIDGLTGWDTSSATSMWGMFQHTGITNLDALATGTRPGNNYISWNTSKVTNMSEMFSGAALTDISALSSWDVSNVTNMSYMFRSCTSLTAVDALSPLNNWTINASLNKSYMFHDIPDTVLRPTWY